MTAFRIEHLHADYSAVFYDGRKVGIIFPARGEDELALYPNPALFPDLTFTGLPAPMEPRFMTFGSMDALAVFLGIPEDAQEAA